MNIDRPKSKQTNEIMYFIIGASGSGKTTALKSIEKNNPNNFLYYFFDSVGVPSQEEMIKNFGSWGKWQKVITEYWIKKMKEKSSNTKPAILDCQTTPLLIEKYCSENGINSYEVILFDCDDKTRKERLIKREQPELAEDRMMNFAKYLREESFSRGYKIIDNTSLTQEKSIEILFNILL